MTRLRTDGVSIRPSAALRTPVLFLALAAGLLPGCVTGIPAKRVPKEFLGVTRANTTPIDMVRLRQDPQPEYRIESRDILGVYIEGVLGGGGGQDQISAPPVQFPEKGGLPPSIGYPIVVREDGTISLPLIEPIKVVTTDPVTKKQRGMTVAQIEAEVRKAYTETRSILPKGKDRTIVTLMRRRTYQVVVVREDATGLQGAANNSAGIPGTAFLLGNAKKGAVFTIDLPADENDVLHALGASGGLPGLDAKNEIQIRRGMFKSATARDEMLASLKAQVANSDPCCPLPPPEPADPNVTIIPLRYAPGQVTRFSQDDIILKNGDVIYIPANSADFFYTGGLLGGGQFQLPRDVDLDVLGAIAMARGPIGGNQNQNQFTGGNLGGIFPASEVIVVRNTPCGQAFPIRVNINKALTDKRERILIQPGDVVIMQYTPAEKIGNALLSMINFQFLFNNGFQGF